MIKTLAVLLFPVFLCGCMGDESGLPSGIRAGGFNLADKEKMAFAITQMKSKSIPFEIQADGSAWYMQKNKAEVLGIIRQAQYGKDLRDNVIESEIITSDLELQAYTKMFKEENIPFKVDTFEGEIHISWSQKYGPHADKIIQEVGFLRAKNYN